jgi:hypothetical protein
LLLLFIQHVLYSLLDFSLLTWALNANGKSIAPAEIIAHRYANQSPWRV